MITLAKQELQKECIMQNFHFAQNRSAFENGITTTNYGKPFSFRNS